MSHFAKVKAGLVIETIVAEPEFFKTFVDSSAGKWIQTSYNTRGGVHYDPNTSKPSADQSKAIRKNYAGVGYSYDKNRDAFVPPRPFPCWILDEQTCLWNAPIARPTDGKRYEWNESTKKWEVTNG